MLAFCNDQIIQVQSFDPVTKYEPHVSKATQVTTSIKIWSEIEISSRLVSSMTDELYFILYFRYNLFKLNSTNYTPTQKIM